MANLGLLLSVAEPSGFWVGIIKAFEAVTNNYVLAIIFLTVVIRLIWGIVETFSKFTQQKQASMQASMQPELEKLKAKYQSQPQVLQQKQNELYKKHMGKGYYGSCIIMLVIMVLNMVIFFTLFSGLNTMATYKTSSNYDNLKYQYANCLNVADKYLGDYLDSTKLELFVDYENLEFKISNETVVDGETGEETLVKKIGLYYKGELVEGSLIDYKTDFSTEETVVNEGTGEDEKITITTNENIIALLNKVFPSNVEGGVEIVIDTVVVDETTQELYLSTAIQNVAMKTVIKTYEETKDSFLWIENVWIADSPFNKSIVSYKTLEGQIGKKNIQEGEETIYNAFMLDLSEAKSRTNGYFILPILCVAASLLSMYITSLYNKYKNKKKGIVQAKTGFKWSQIIIPLIFGIFALFYNSVFAIYMLTGQVVSACLTPLQLLVVDKIIDRKKKKDDDKVVIEYSRKF